MHLDESNRLLLKWKWLFVMPTLDNYFEISGFHSRRTVHIAFLSTNTNLLRKFIPISDVYCCPTSTYNTARLSQQCYLQSRYWQALIVVTDLSNRRKFQVSKNGLKIFWGWVKRRVWHFLDWFISQRSNKNQQNWEINNTKHFSFDSKFQ